MDQRIINHLVELNVMVKRRKGLEEELNHINQKINEKIQKEEKIWDRIKGEEELEKIQIGRS